MWIVVKVCRVFLRWRVCEPGTLGDTAAEDPYCWRKGALPVRRCQSGVTLLSGEFARLCAQRKGPLPFALKLEESRLMLCYLEWHCMEIPLG